MTMDQLINGFPAQLKEALEIGKRAKLTKPENEIHNVIVSGLGGSGIGGNLVASLVSKELNVPFSINKGYFAPGYMDRHSLVIISSYSGNTEETFAVLEQSAKTGAKIVCITSGGKIMDFAKSHNLDCIEIPGGRPPRASLGYSFVQQLFVLHANGLIGDDFIPQVEASIKLLTERKEHIQATAKRLSDQMKGSIPILYSADAYEPVAVRFRQQINENAKMLCWHHVIPEMNHNELVGWRKRDETLSVLFIRNKDDFSRVQQRMELNKQIISEYTPRILELYSEGDSKMAKSLYLIHVGDWMSFYLSEGRNIDPVEVKVIDYLKGALAEKAW